ncbi:MAG: hypothetical protein R6V15_13535, partial [Desulfotignum sp.]
TLVPMPGIATIRARKTDTRTGYNFLAAREGSPLLDRVSRLMLPGLLMPKKKLTLRLMPAHRFKKPDQMNQQLKQHRKLLKQLLPTRTDKGLEDRYYV